MARVMDSWPGSLSADLRCPCSNIRVLDCDCDWARFARCWRGCRRSGTGGCTGVTVAVTGPGSLAAGAAADAVGLVGVPV